MKIFINPGHAPNGVPDPGAINKEYGINEAEVVAYIGKWVANYLEQAGLEVELCQQDNLCIGDNSVIAKANTSGADLFLSIHANAFVDDSAHGTETYCFCYGGEGERLARDIQYQLIHSINTNDRGVKTASYAVLRGTTMPAVLTEICFITNNDDVQLLLTEAGMIQIARAIARGVTDYIAFC